MARHQLLDLSIQETSGVDSPANRSQAGGAAGWIVMKADGTEKAGMVACTTADCNMKCLPGAATCPAGHTQKTEKSEEDLMTDQTEALAKAEADLEAANARIAELEANAAPAPVVTDEAEALTKAMAEVPAVVREALEKAERSAAAATEAAADAIAKAEAERDARLDRESILKAETFTGLAIPSGEFGPVLRSAEALLPEETYAKLETILRAASDTLAASALLAEVGSPTISASTAYEAIRVEAAELRKSETGLTEAAAIAKVYELRPDLVAAYREER